MIGGGIRGRAYARAVREHPNAEVVAFCEASSSAAASLADEFGLPVHADPATLLSEHPDLTAAVIATPDASHLAPTLACLERGVDLLIEKPLATDVASAQEMADTARRVGARTMVAFENRWNPKFQAVRNDLQRSGGRVINQVVNLNDTIFVPTRMLTWAAQTSPLWFLFPHCLDLAIWLGGSRPVDVVARAVREHLPTVGIETVDAVSAIFTMADGSVVSLNSQWVLPEGMPAVFDFRYDLNTTAAAYRIEISDSGVTRYGRDGVNALHAPSHDQQGRETGTIPAMVDDFIAALDGADLPLPDVNDGLLVTQALAAAHQSLTDGRVHPVLPGDGAAP